MNILIFTSKNEIGTAAGNYIAASVTENPKCTLGLATGSTPLEAYAQMIKLYESGAVDFSGVTTFNLDEYAGLDETDENSYHAFMHKNLFDSINVLPENINFLDGCAPDLESECSRYEEKIENCGGIDMQLLGLGSNGHIAFNEPAPAFENATHPVKLKESTINDNARFFDSKDSVPKMALTMGIGTIMRAKKILIIATGKNKAAAVRSLIYDNPTPACPATVLQFHPNVTVMLDSSAAELL
ncbi:MAG: glucosamine-6-phosphate deaminase [Clostridiales bacterium]|nr:glucosamine-6-phosphate deaminase [Clostridiales bacterium]